MGTRPAAGLGRVSPACARRAAGKHDPRWAPPPVQRVTHICFKLMCWQNFIPKPARFWFIKIMENNEFNFFNIVAR